MKYSHVSTKNNNNNNNNFKIIYLLYFGVLLVKKNIEYSK